jgi:hypothetical protein
MHCTFVIVIIVTALSALGEVLFVLWGPVGANAFVTSRVGVAGCAAVAE